MRGVFFLCAFYSFHFLNSKENDQPKITVLLSLYIYRKKITVFHRLNSICKVTQL